MREFIDRIVGDEDDPDCRCSATIEGGVLAIDTSSCDGRLAEAPACRETAVCALRGEHVEHVRVRAGGVDRHYDGEPVALLAAAGRFADLVRDEDPVLADEARRDPLGAARAAAARASPVDEIAAETGLTLAADGVGSYDQGFRPAIAPTIANARIETAPPPDARLRDARDLPRGATVRRYDVPGDGASRYHLRPVETGFDRPEYECLAAAYERLAEGTAGSPAAAVRSAILGERASTAGSGPAAVDGGGDPDDGTPVRTLARVLRKHTQGFGILEDLFADPLVSDVYASGPAADLPLWVVTDGEPTRTNVQLSDSGVAAVASRIRRESGQSFSRASPTVDASAEIGGETVRIAGVVDPATEGHAFAFRSGGEKAFTLPALIANGTLPAEAAGLLSVAVRRDAASLVAGARGAGKTTALGALLWELPTTTRTIVIEDTPELPVSTLQSEGRDVQPLHATLEDGPGIAPTEALHTALRLGESAIVLGEVRGEEAAVLYEAMRVGASGSAVLGTIHGDGGADVRERVVGDLGVPESSFAATDLVVTCEQYRTATGDRGRRVRSIEETVPGDHGVAFEALYDLADDGLVPTGRLDRGNSRLLESLARSGESYAAIREQIESRGAFLGRLADRGSIEPGAVTAAYARRGANPC